MLFGDLFSLQPLPDSAVPTRKRRLLLIGLVWFAGLGLVTAAQVELDSLEPDARAALAPTAGSPAGVVAQSDASRFAFRAADRDAVSQPTLF